jgi:hypothetical protein
MPSSQHLNILWNASDDTLYFEAVALLRHLVNEKDCIPLPTSQIAGLLNSANASSYTELERFLCHQRDRNWPESRKDIKIFYTGLREKLNTLRKKWLVERFQLVPEGKSAHEVKEEGDKLMALVAREFIQHLIAENMVLIAALKTERAKKW